MSHDESWADKVIARHVWEGEHHDDWQLAIIRTEARIREQLDLHVANSIDLLRRDAETMEYLRENLYDADEIEELQRRLRWHEEQSARPPEPGF